MSTFPNFIHGGLKWREKCDSYPRPRIKPSAASLANDFQNIIHNAAGVGLSGLLAWGSSETGTGDAPFPGAIADIALFWRWPWK